MKTYNPGYYSFFKTSEMITVQIATVPHREDMLQTVINSLINQVDRIHVMLNGHKDIPYFLKQLEFHTDKIEYFKMDNSTGDAAKFYGVEKLKDYVFTCDDDIQYPADYIQIMIAELQRHGNKVILTNHGREMNRKPVTSIYSDRIATHHTFAETKSVKLDIGGSGVMAWHTDFFKPKYLEFKRKNMADIWVAKQAKEQGLKIMMNPHPANWLVPLDLNEKEPSVWDSKYENNEEETKIYNSF